MNINEEHKVPASALIPGPYSFQMKGHVWAAWLLKLIGWRVDFQGLPTLQGVAIVYPAHQQLGFLHSDVVQVDHGLALVFLVQRFLVENPFVRSMASMDWRRAH